MNNAVASGSYADMKLVKTRSVCQIVVEIPIEQASRFIEMFGVPVPGAEIPVAIARLNEGAGSAVADSPQEAQDSEKPRRKFEDMSPSQQAGMLCADNQFWAFLSHKNPTKWHGHPQDQAVPSDEQAARFVRDLCGVRSRSALDTLEPARDQWRALVAEFRNWQTDKRYGGMRR